MNVLIPVIGSRGDIEPFAMIGERLASLGANVLILSSAFHEETVSKRGVRFEAIGSMDLNDFISTLKECRELPLNARNALLYQRWLLPQLHDIQTAVAGIQQTVDLVLDYSLDMSQFAQAKRAKLARFVFDVPDDAVLANLDAFRRKFCGPERALIFAMERDLVDPEQKWSNGQAFTGHCVEFANSHFTPPGCTGNIAVCMGSMPMSSTDRFFENLGELAKRLEVNIHVVLGWEARPETTPQNVYIDDGQCLDRLFQTCDAVIHHGGTGTAVVAAASNTPSVVFPLLPCQFSFAKCLREAGFVHSIFERWPGIEVMSEELKEMVSADQTFTPLCQSLQETDGVGNAVELLTDFIKGTQHAKSSIERTIIL